MFFAKCSFFLGLLNLVNSNKYKNDLLLWTPAYGQAKAGRPARTYVQQLCEDTGCSPEDLPEVMNNREKWRERVRDVRAGGMTWWLMYHRTNVLCCKERSPQKKKYSNSKVREENIAVVFIQLWLLQLKKFIFLRPSSPFLSVVTGCGWELAFDTRLS